MPLPAYVGAPLFYYARNFVLYPGRGKSIKEAFKYASSSASATYGSTSGKRSSRRSVTKKSSSKSSPMYTPRYGPGSSLPGGAASGFQDYPNKKRKFSSSGDEVVILDAAGYKQLTRVPKTTIGSKLSREELCFRHVEANMLSRIDRFQDMRKASDSNGPYWLSYTPDAATPTKYFLPVYAFDLTSLNSNTGYDAAGAVCTWQAYPFLRLSRSTGAGNAYGWETQTCVTSAGVSGVKTWASEKVPYVTAANNTPYNKALLRWADIRMQVWGATTEPSSIEVMLVRFHDENIGPPSIESSDSGATQVVTHPVPPYVAAGASGSNDFAQYQKFWTSQVDNLLGTPNMVRLKSQDSKGMSVLYRKVIELNPTANYETDTTGHQYTLKFNYIMDMICDYNHSAATSVAGDQATDISDPNRWVYDVGTSENRSVLKNRNSRVYLLIKGLATTNSAVSATGAGSQAATASFDLCVRRCITLI